ncbi:hypothetical protein Aple_077490 [Acrocarpospora pleiomorpha]|uniref:Uncharacterized protein n=1 Tax=Acrocarpospora pleiomorpha TaxID=90975 RepID=A0A5M3XVC0_9ACTN|nr:hypothetical protein Aple_077490 [Acrocarpospora pleiomorpha]
MSGLPVAGRRPGGPIRVLVVLRGVGIIPIIPIIPIALAAPIALIILAAPITLTRVWPGRRYGSGCARGR